MGAADTVPERLHIAMNQLGKYCRRGSLCINGMKDFSKQ